MTQSTQPSHTNRLIHATSPYLLQHAHNPVDWYPWGDEAIERAKADNKPIFLSIGYSACHWCHVMERESFENDEIAAVLNEHFVSIKVDREERPDLDEIYMAATVLYNQGQGGWPMSVFLTPDRKPFFAGTYFPPFAKFGRPGFRELLLQIARLWKEDRDRLLRGADALTDAVRQYSEIEPGSQAPSADLIARTAEGYLRIFDMDKGGILSGGTNKFPPSMAMQLMLRHYARTRAAGKPDARLLDAVTITLDCMANGGIYDQLGGGICRYSTDPDWLVPHFEKMLYDQALVSDVYLDAYMLTKKPLYARIAREILDYVLADLQSPQGGFYSTRDADSEGQEGKYYVWTLDEVRRVLGEPDATWFAAYYDVTESGNWNEAHGHAPPGPKNILRITRPLDVVAKLHDVSEPQLAESLARSRQKLLDVRRRRVPPALDDKVLTSWNGLMIASLAKGSRVLNEPKYRDAAARAADFILAKLATHEGRLLRTYRDGKAHTDGYLDDYAFFIEALLNLYEATFDLKWLDHARQLTDQTIARFHDSEHGGFFFVADDAEQMLVRTKDAGDNAVPGANSVHAMNLLRLAVLYDRDDLRAKAAGAFRAFARRLEQSPFGSDRLLAALDFMHHPPIEVAIIGPAGAATAALASSVWDRYNPNKVVAGLDPGDVSAVRCAAVSPLLADRPMVQGKPTAYVCVNYACRRPVTTVAELASQMEAATAPAGTGAVRP